MFKQIFWFEWRYRITRPATWAYFGILLFFGCLISTYGTSPASEKTHVNSPYSIAYLMAIISIFQMLMASAVMGVPIYRDIEHKTIDYLFAYPLREKSYFIGRYIGSFTILVIIAFGYLLGLWLGSPLGVLFGNIEPERVGSFSIENYLYPFLVITIPNIFFTGTVFFSLVALTRNILATYVGSVLLFVGYLLSSTLTHDLDNNTLVDILDPFALTTYTNATKYWTPQEQNTLLIPLQGNFLINRLLWVAISLMLFSFTYFRFSFKSMLEITGGKKKSEENAIDSFELSQQLPNANKLYSSVVFLKKMFRLSWLELRNITKDFYFIAMFLGGALFLFLDGWVGDISYGTPSLPITYYMLEAKDVNYITFVFIIIIFYAGEVAHRDKSLRFSSIVDVLPVPNWVMLGSKFLSLVWISFLLTNLVMVCGIVNQAIKGYFNFQFSMYFTDLYLIELPEYLQLAMLAFFVHILVNRKFLGHVISIGIWILMFGMHKLADIDNNLFFYSHAPGYRLSDMNGFGHFLTPISWFNFYWLCLGALFLVIGNLFWNRGMESGLVARWKLACIRFTRISGMLLIFFFLAWVGSGAFIYYNTNILNRYFTSDEEIQIGVNYEKEYKRFEFMPQPKITDVKINMDLFPYERSAIALGRFTLVNKTKKGIDSLMLEHNSDNSEVVISLIQLNGQDLALLSQDPVSKVYFYKLTKTMQPGDTSLLSLQVRMRYRGFTNDGIGHFIVYNGTFFDMRIFPSFGYSGDRVGSDKERKKHGLPIKYYSAPPQNDFYGLSTFLFNDDADYVTFEATISTPADQIAVAPGYLEKEWEENGRKYYYYKMDKPMDLFANFSSARYSVLRDVWTGNAGNSVSIEIFHHPTHTYNLDRYVKAVKASLDYYSKNYRAYQYRQMRILEFPRYATFAQSFPNTVPYSENAGWVADFSDPNNTDYAFYLTAHEVAHQWWGHMVMPSFTRGANQVSESMAEYSALMVLQHEYGKDCMQNRLKYSLDRYLRGRSAESKFEETLLNNDSREYVWYDKGSLILYALQDYIGEDNLNHAFKSFLDSAAFRQRPPFATSNEWYSYIKAATPDSLQYFLQDSFEKIALYENRITNASYTEQPDSSFHVNLTVQAQKIYYDSSGRESSRGTKMDLIEIGIFGEDVRNSKGMIETKPLYLRKHWLAPGEHKLDFIVRKRPIKAGIDPYNKLIDRIPSDNLKAVVPN